jgi:hypothetical protein
MSHEHLSNPEQQAPSWDDVLLGVVERSAMPQPPIDSTQLVGCNRLFYAPDGNFLTLTGKDVGDHWDWSIRVSPTKDKVYAVSWQGEITLPPTPADYSFDIRPQDGANHVFEPDSDEPLSPDSVQQLLATVVNSRPALEPTYAYHNRPTEQS